MKKMIQQNWIQEQNTLSLKVLSEEWMYGAGTMRKDCMRSEKITWSSKANRRKLLWQS